MQLLYWYSIPTHLLPQLVESTVVVVPHIAEGLPKLLTDLQEGITVEEIQTQGFPLALRQRFEHLVQTITPKDGFSGIITLRGRITDHMIRRVLDLRVCIELACNHITAPLDGTVVGHLDDPRACGTLGAVKDAAP